MKKLLLLLLIVASVIGCKEFPEVKPETPDSGTIFFDTERAIKEAKEYGINTSEIEINMSNKCNDSTICFTGRQDGKLWIGTYNCLTKAKINNSISNDKFDFEIKTLEPYVGEVIDTIKHFYVGDVEYDGNNYVFILALRLNRPNVIEYLFSNMLVFSENNIIKLDLNQISGTCNLKKWGGNSVLIGNSYNNFDNFRIQCYSMTGELLYEAGSSSRVMEYIPTNNIYDGIWIEGNAMERINIKTETKIWESNIDLKAPSDAKISLIKSEATNDNNTIILTYEITLYNGTKSEQIVEVDANTGKYKLIANKN